MTDSLRARLVHILEYWRMDGEDEAVRQLETAFRDAHYCYMEISDNHTVMTGQEWYERFEKEFNNISHGLGIPTLSIVHSAIEGVAKRAAGLSDEII